MPRGCLLQLFFNPRAVDLTVARLFYLFSAFGRHRLLRLLDDGCGGGGVILQISELAEVVGIDPAIERFKPRSSMRKSRVSFIRSIGE